MYCQSIIFRNLKIMVLYTYQVSIYQGRIKGTSKKRVTAKIIQKIQRGAPLATARETACSGKDPAQPKIKEKFLSSLVPPQSGSPDHHSSKTRMV